MTPRKAKTEREYELYMQRFNSMGLELPEVAAANPASIRSVASFLLKHGVFGDIETATEAEASTQDENKANAAPRNGLDAESNKPEH